MRLARRRRLRWAALLLPALLLRSLIPVGFMPMFGPGLSVSLMLCPAYAPLPARSGSAPSVSSRAEPASGVSMGPSDAGSISMDMDMDMPPQPAAAPAPGGKPDHQDHASCPYAASATLAGSPSLSASLPTERVPSTVALRLAALMPIQVIARAQSARAPPAV